MKKILISVSPKKSKEYSDAVKMAGGIADACYLPERFNSLQISLDEFCSLLCKEYDGLILGGGGDVNPERYGEKIDGSKRIDDERDKVEFGLIDSFMKLGKPIMGICRGIQIMNIALGGTIYQDNGIDYNQYHTSEDFTFKVHPTYCESSFLQELYGKEFCVNSHHHQSLKKVASCLIPIQYSVDKKCVEGVIHKSYPFIGIQWHPERLCRPNEMESGCVDGLPIFKYFMSLVES